MREEVSNFHATSSRYPEEAKFVNKVLVLYESLGSNLSSTFPRELTSVLQMYWTCFRCVVISARLIFEAHIPEAFAILSRSAEAVGSARKMSNHPEKIEGWIKKDRKTSQPFIRILGTLFPKGDALIYPEIYQIWDTTVEHGRHPNFVSTIFFSDFGEMSTENKVNFTFNDIADDVNLRRTINYIIYAYLKFLSAFREIFKKYLTKEWVENYEGVEQEYNTYKQTLRSVFQSE